MTNDNNKINELVSYPDDDPTAELEIPSMLSADLHQHDRDSGTDAVDDFGDAGNGHPDALSISVLKSNLISSGEQIERLQLEIAQSRANSQLLEEELGEAIRQSTRSAGDAEQIRLVAKEDRSRVFKLEKQLASREKKVRSLEKKLGAQLDHSQNESAELENSRKILMEQSGQICGYAQEIRELQTRVGGSEKYADDIRQKLQEQSEISDRALKTQQVLQATLAAAQIRAGALSESLKISDQRKTQLTDTVSHDGKKFAEEIRQLQSSLDMARESIIDQTATNENLQSDLLDNKEFREALEIQLRETEEINDRRIRHLEKKANRLRNQADEYERKLKNKDNAISALMNELANRSSKVEAIGDIENVIQEIDNRNTSRPATRGPNDRVTRLLVGRTDGQELRFPLFKNRLTIGRTEHNDIQLNAQFISRRHAVIVTESNGTRIVDWGSRNGVFINDKRVAEKILKNGDVVTIGTTEFRYEERPKK